MKQQTRNLAVIGALLCATALPMLSSCADDAPAHRVIGVPSDASTIAKAVDQARPGDIVLIEAGVYHESIRVDTHDITIRGVDRNEVVLDGEDTLANGFLVAADNVAIENLTVHSYTNNGVVFSGIEAVSGGKGADPNAVYGTGDDVLEGFRVSYVTSYNNGLYGIYAFASRDGVIEWSYVSGHPDSGIYVGQCNPCNTVVRHVTAELNAIGYYGTNASGDVYVIESVFQKNRLGIAPNSQKAERLAPQEATVIAGNLVVDNASAEAPAIVKGFAGGGIAVGGGTKNTVLRNRVQHNGIVGIAVLSLNEYSPLSNRIEGNEVTDNEIDLIYAPTSTTGSGGNCFVDNVYGTSLPRDIEVAMPCDGSGTLADLAPVTFPAAAPGPDYREVPAPPAQPTMPTELMSAIGGAGVLALAVDLSTIVIPDP